MYNYATEILKYSQSKTVSKSTLAHDACSCHLTL